MRAQINSSASGTKVRHTSPGRICKVRVRVPCVESQARIADILSAYDDLIENNRRRIALLEQAAREIYREWFVRFRFPSHETTRIVNGLLEGWECKKIADVCLTTGGGTPSTKRAEYWEGDVTWVVPTDVTNNDCLVLLDTARKITEKGLRESSAKMVSAETILMTSRASVGFFAIMDREVCTNQGFINVVPHDEGIRLYLLFNLMNRVSEIRSNAPGHNVSGDQQRTISRNGCRDPDESDRLRVFVQGFRGHPSSTMPEALNICVVSSPRHPPPTPHVRGGGGMNRADAADLIAVGEGCPPTQCARGTSAVGWRCERQRDLRDDSAWCGGRWRGRRDGRNGRKIPVRMSETR